MPSESHYLFCSYNFLMAVEIKSGTFFVAAHALSYYITTAPVFPVLDYLSFRFHTHFVN